MPRMDEAEKLAYGATLAITEEGMTIFNTQFNRYEYWDGGAWVTIATGASLTGTSLDDVYDAGGLGAGRTITADQGAVQILDADGLHVQGNVGIGTVAPGTILHVEKSAIDNSIQDVLRLQTHISSSGLGGGIQFRNRWSNGDYWTMGRITAIEQNGFGGQLIFSTNLGSGTADDVTAEAMRIDENGRLGIGTTTPAEELHVIGDIRSSALIGGGNVQADASGNLIVSNDLPGADDSYIHNQNALDQAANYRINGWGEAFGLKINSGDGEKVQFTSLGASGSKIRHTTGWAIDYHAGPGNTTTTGSHRFYTTAQNIYRERLGIENTGRIHIRQDIGNDPAFTGLESPEDANGRAQLVLSSSYSDLVIASSEGNNNHGSTLTFATYNPGDANDYRKFVINQGNWGARAGYLDFGFANVGGRANPHININSTDNVVTMDGYNKRLGVGTMNPGAKLHVANTSPSNWEWSNLSTSVSMELGSNTAGNVGSIRMNSYNAGQFVFLRPSNGNYHIDATTGQYYFNWDESVRGGSNGAIHMANEAGGHTIELNTAGNSWFTGGSLGIGTTGPAQALHVMGNSRISGLAGAGNRMVYANASGDLVASGSGSDPNTMVDGTGATNRVAYWSDANSLTSDGNFTYTGNNLIVGSSSWSAHQLHFSSGWTTGGYHATIGTGYTGTTAAGIMLGNPHIPYRASYGAKMRFASDQAASFYWDLGFNGEAGGSTDRFDLNRNNANLMTVTNTGSVGIGTTAPSGRLHVNNTDDSNMYYSSTGNLYLSNPEASTAQVRIGAAWNRPGVYSNQQLELFSDATGIIFGDSNVERMRMEAGGDFGVGVTNPAYRIHAGGDIYADGGWLRVSGNQGLHFESYGTGIHSVQADGGEYGSVSTYGNVGGWEGYSMGGRYVWMTNNGDESGYYNDVDNYWYHWTNRLWTNDGMRWWDSYYGVQAMRVQHTNGWNYASYDGDSNWDFYSDRRLKENIENEDNILDRLLKLDVVNYDFILPPDTKERIAKAEKEKGVVDNGEKLKEIGFIAQEVEKYFPSLVSETEDERYDFKVKALGYSSFGVLAVGAIKELKIEKDAEIQELKTEVEELKNLVKELLENQK